MTLRNYLFHEEEGIALYCGDALHILPELENITAVLTDPPYSSGGMFRGDRMQGTVAKYVDGRTLVKPPEFTGDNRDQRGYLAWCGLWMSAARQACTPGAQILTFTDWRQLPTVSDALQCGGWVWRGIATWYKPGIRMQRGRFSGSSEFVLFGTNGPAMDHDGAPSSVFAAQPVDEKYHVAEKPEAVATWLLSVVPPGAIVLDPFFGSGTFLRVAKDLGHRAIGIEIEPRYCEIAVKRLRQEVLAL